MKTLLMNRYFDNGSYHSGYTKIICQIQLAHRRNTLVLLIIIISNSGIQRTVSHRRNIVFNSSAQNPVWVDGHWLATDGTARSGKYPPRGGWDLTTTNPRDRVADCLLAVWSSGPNLWSQAKAFTQLWANERNHSRTRCCSCR